MGGGTSRTTVRYTKSKSQKIKSSDKSKQTQLDSGTKRNVFISLGRIMFQNGYKIINLI